MSRIFYLDMMGAAVMVYWFSMHNAFSHIWRVIVKQSLLRDWVFPVCWGGALIELNMGSIVHTLSWNRETRLKANKFCRNCAVLAEFFFFRRVSGTYLQKESPLGFETQIPPFLHGLGEQETKPRKKNTFQFLVSTAHVAHFQITWTSKLQVNQK